MTEFDKSVENSILAVSTFEPLLSYCLTRVFVWQLWCRSMVCRHETAQKRHTPTSRKPIALSNVLFMLMVLLVNSTRTRVFARFLITPEIYVGSQHPLIPGRRFIILIQNNFVKQLVVTESVWAIDPASGDRIFWSLIWVPWPPFVTIIGRQRR